MSYVVLGASNPEELKWQPSGTHDSVRSQIMQDDDPYRAGTMGDPVSLSKDPLHRVFQSVRIAWYANRAIVPVVGAGLSADAGIPIIRSVVRYFGKFHQFLDHRAYLPPIAVNGHTPFRGGDPLEPLKHYYLLQPWQYVAHFGWPDRFQLTQDLQHFLDCLPLTKGGEDSAVASEVCKGLNGTLERLNPGGYWHLRELLLALVGRKQAALIFPELSGPAGAEDAPHIITDQIVAEAVVRRLGRDESNNSVPFNLVGDWKRLIQYFTNYHGDYADALFSRLCAGRGPQQGHAYLAFLVKLLGIKTILTFNFDDLIEQSLQLQGIHPRVFAMEEGRGLPHEAVVRDTVSVIKLHGSNHALLVDERLDHPLSGTYKQRFDELVATDPLLVVIGCSGEDRRLRDLIEHVLNTPAKLPGRRVLRVAWLHFEPNPPSFLAPYVKLELAIVAQANSPAATLLHCYSTLTNRHPASTHPYLAHAERPVPVGHITGSDNRKSEPNGLDGLFGGRFSLAVISTYDQGQDPNAAGDLQNSRPYPERSASRSLLDLAAFWLAKGYHTIWVDLEAVHTLAGVVGSILDQCRRYDVSLAASVLPSVTAFPGEPDAYEGLPPLPTVVRAAVHRVSHALQRARYFVALDGLETYLWPPLTHHGQTLATDEEGGAQLDSLIHFFDDLIETEGCGESKICIGIDSPKQRMPAPGVSPLSKKLTEFIGKVRNRGNLKYPVIPLQSKLLPYSMTFNFGWPKKITRRIADAPSQSPSPADDAASFPIVGLEQSVRHALAESLPLESRNAVTMPSFIAIVVFYLSCFRRTRHLTLLRHLLEPFMPTGRGSEGVEALLYALAHCPELSLHRLEGANYWFDRVTRDFVYSRNSEYAVSRYAISQCKALDIDALRYTVPQLFLLMIVHHQIARAYYNRMFMQSQDTFAFLEYTYHRVSSIRYLVKLLAIIKEASGAVRAPALTDRSNVGNAAIHEILEGFRRTGALFRSAIGQDRETAAYDDDRFDRIRRRMGIYVHDADLSEPQRRTSALAQVLDEASKPLRNGSTEAELDQSAIQLADIYLELQRWHTHSIGGLQSAWVRAEKVLREQIPAQQLLHWCRCLLDEELPMRLNNVVLEYDASKRRAMPWTSERSGINAAAEDICARFADALRDLRVKLWIERSEYLECVKGRHQQLSDAGLVLPGAEHRDAYADAWKAAMYLPSKEKLGQIRLEHLHWIVDIAVCFIKHFQTRHRPTKTEASPDHTEVKKILRWFDDSFGDRVGFHPKSREASSLSVNPDRRYDEVGDVELAMRLCDLRAKVAFETVSYFSTGFNGRVPIPLRPEYSRRSKSAEESINEALGILDEGGPELSSNPRNAIIDPARDGSLHAPYRSIFYSARARGLGYLHLASQTESQASSSGTFDEFAAVFRSIEMARAGLEGGNPLLAAITEIYGVEACLVWSRLALYCPDGTSAEDVERRLEQAAAKHELARFGLQRAERNLRDSHRNVIWWRFFYLMVGQYHAERLLLGFTRLVYAFPALDNGGRSKFRLYLAEGYRTVHYASSEGL